MCQNQWFKDWLQQPGFKINAKLNPNLNLKKIAPSSVSSYPWLTLAADGHFTTSVNNG